MIKKLEHFWKGLSNNSSQISPIPPEGYGDRFVNFITGITMTKEEAERQKQSNEQQVAYGGSIDTYRSSQGVQQISPVDRTMNKAEKQALKTERHGANEDETPERVLSSIRSPSAERSNGNAGSTLPIVEEVGEAGSTGGRSGRSGQSDAGAQREKDASEERSGRGNQDQDGHLVAEKIKNSSSSFLFPSTSQSHHGHLANEPEKSILQVPPLSASPPPLEPEKSIVSNPSNQFHAISRWTD